MRMFKILIVIALILVTQSCNASERYDYGWRQCLSPHPVANVKKPVNVEASSSKYAFKNFMYHMSKGEDFLDIAKSTMPNGAPEKDVELVARQISMLNNKKVFSDCGIVDEIIFENGTSYVSSSVISKFYKVNINWVGNPMFQILIESENIVEDKNGTPQKPKVIYDDDYICDAIIRDGKSYIPIRTFSETIGEEIQWNDYGVILGEDASISQKVKVPVFVSSNGADMRNWHYAIFAGTKWGVCPALLVAVRYHENPSHARDFYALGVKHARRAGTGIWGQYDQGARVIKYISTRQNWNPLNPTQNNLYRCGQSYAEGSRTWGNKVWQIYRRVKR